MDIIHTYTRKEAIADGFQVQLNEATTKEAGFNTPIFMTSGINNLIEKAVANDNFCNDTEGITWDILTMLRFAIKRAQNNGNRIEFVVKIMGAARKQNFLLVAIIGPMDIDNPAPAMTIMLPEEE